MCKIAEPKMDILNQPINMEQQEQQQPFVPLNTGILMDPREMEANANGQPQGLLLQGNQQENQQENGLQLSLQRTQQQMRQQDGMEDPQTAQRLERAADVGFKKGINSRKGACDSRDAKNKKVRARKKLNNAAGLTEYSGALSDQLKGNVQREAERDEYGSKYFDRWASSGAGQETLKDCPP
ncbi:MAG: hypothetical protein RR315_05810, partial [Oscillospiraceae bacterium]